jgi:hypothetical protein
MRGVDDAACAERRSSLCCHPSLVAIASSNEAFEYPVFGTGLEVKTNELEKSYKEFGGSGSETP